MAAAVAVAVLVEMNALRIMQAPAAMAEPLLVLLQVEGELEVAKETQAVMVPTESSGQLVHLALQVQQAQPALIQVIFGYQGHKEVPVPMAVVVAAAAAAAAAVVKLVLFAMTVLVMAAAAAAAAAKAARVAPVAVVAVLPMAYT